MLTTVFCSVDWVSAGVWAGRGTDSRFSNEAKRTSINSSKRVL